MNRVMRKETNVSECCPSSEKECIKVLQYQWRDCRWIMETDKRVMCEYGGGSGGSGGKQEEKIAQGLSKSA